MTKEEPKISSLHDQDEIVISGIGGRFPDSDNVKQFQENLLNKVDLVTEDHRRWDIDHPLLPKRAGKINGLEKFDARFFGIHARQAKSMDPLSRMLLEHAYEAIVDAGVNPRQVRNSRMGVFMAGHTTKPSKTGFLAKNQSDGGARFLGTVNAMLANRVSYWLGVHGPSFTLDATCASSIYLVDQACRSIRDGTCDSALVGGGNLCIDPFLTMQFTELGVLSNDGRCKTFDEAADGYARSEAACVIFLQKKTDARRIYATVVQAKSNSDGYKDEGITFPSKHVQSALFKEIFQASNVSPTEVDYVEAHGTGTKIGDLEEMSAIDNVFTPGRKKPLKIGALKTNMGHAESASGLCSIAKAVTTLESGVIPPNLHYKNPRKDAKGLVEGRMTVVTEPTKLEGEYIGINSFGVGGTNAHLLLKANSKEKMNNGAPNDDLPRLVAISGCTEDAVSTIIKALNESPVDVEYVKLFHEIHSENIQGHLYRGFTVLPPRKTDSQTISEISSCHSLNGPVCFVFSGVGSQWPGMGESLLRLPVFENSIKKCDAVLKPLGIDIFSIITDKNEKTFDNVMNLFLGVAAIQIGLVDVLRSIGIEPDYVMGHSFGELACAYTDGCLTAEQTILLAHARGKVFTEEKFTLGSMASINLGYEELVKICPSDIDLACYNTSNNITISGPAQSVKGFVDEMTKNKIFAKEVDCSNVPYHSRYITSVGPPFSKYVQKIIPSPKARSSKWISTSNPIDKWNTVTASFASPEYFVNNLLSPVLFDQALSLIPENAITIEIAPHSLFNSILQRELNSSITNIALTKRNCDDGVEFLLKGIGKTFTAGLQPKLANLYPSVELPVSRTTPMISPLIRWEHSEDWFVPWHKHEQSINTEGRLVTLSLSDERYQSLAGHVMDGKNVFPYSVYLILAWETFAITQNKLYSDLSVTFKEVKFIKFVDIPENGSVDFSVSIQPGTGKFEITVNEAPVAAGYIYANINSKIEDTNFPENLNEQCLLTSADVYQELKSRGHHNSGMYKNITCASMDGSYGRIIWQNDWISFIDNILQMYYFGIDTKDLYAAKFIEKLIIDTETHGVELKNNELPVYIDKSSDLIVCSGIQISGLRANSIVRNRLTGIPVKEEFKFISYLDKADTDIQEILGWIVQVVSENNSSNAMKIIEILEDVGELSTKKLMISALSQEFDRMSVNADYSVISEQSEVSAVPSNVSVISPKQVNAKTNAYLAIGNHLLTKSQEDKINLLLLGLTDNGFILTRENISKLDDLHKVAEMKQMDVVFEKKFEDEIFVLLRKRIELPENILIIPVNNDNFDWLDEMKKSLRESLKSMRILFVGQNTFDNGLIGFINCLKEEQGGHVVRGFLIQDPQAPTFTLQNPFYYNQVRKDLVMNVLRENGVWGNYHYKSLPPFALKPVQKAKVDQLIHGDINSLTWLVDSAESQLKETNVIDVYYSSVNLRDVALGIGKLPLECVKSDRIAQDPIFGIEYSGIDASGERKMGFVAKGSLSSTCTADPILSWKIPSDWNFEDGATVPVVYSITSYLLYTKGRMNKSHKVLIHDGDSDFGQAAINLALHEGCEIFTTVNSMIKYHFILQHFPHIPKNHITCVQNSNFERMIVTQTKGVGVDIVISYHDFEKEYIQDSINCLGKGGRYLYVDKSDSINDDHLEIRLSHEISFHILSPNQVTSSEEIKLEVQKLVSDGLKNGSIKPIARSVYPKEDLIAAFNSSNRDSMGKILLKIRDEKNSNSLISALPQYRCLENRSYIIVDGLGDVGLELADWLVQRGARNLILTAHNGFTNAYQKMRVSLWQSYGVRVVIVKGKGALTYDDCQSIVETAQGIAPVDALFNLTSVTNDAEWDKQTKESFEESLRSKVWATRHFDDLTRKSCQELRNFVVFSTYSNTGISCGMANSAMERVVEKRASEGFPALAVKWGPVGDEDKHLRELEEFMLQDRPVVSCVLLEEKVGASNASANAVLDTVVKLMGIKDLDTIGLDKPLSEMGLDSMLTVFILNTLESKHGIVLKQRDIHTLTFAKLKEMSSNN